MQLLRGGSQLHVCSSPIQCLVLSSSLKYVIIPTKELDLASFNGAVNTVEGSPNSYDTPIDRHTKSIAIDVDKHGITKLPPLACDFVESKRAEITSGRSTSNLEEPITRYSNLKSKFIIHLKTDKRLAI